MYKQTHIERDGIVAIITTDDHGSFGQLLNGERFALEGGNDDHETLVDHYLSEGWTVSSR